MGQDIVDSQVTRAQSIALDGRQQEPGVQIASTVVCLFVLVVLSSLHFWRYRQTKSRYHVIWIGAFIASIIYAVMALVGNRPVMRYASLPFVFLIGWLTILVPCMMLVQWCRSMHSVLGQHVRALCRFTTCWTAMFGVATALVTAGHAFITLTLGAAGSSKRQQQFRATASALTISGHAVAFIGDLLLVALCSWLLSRTPRHTSPTGMATKRKQIILLLVLFSLDATAEAGALISSRIALFGILENIVMVMLFSVGLSPRNAMSGFSHEPESIDNMHEARKSVLFVQPMAMPCALPGAYGRSSLPVATTAAQTAPIITTSAADGTTIRH